MQTAPDVMAMWIWNCTHQVRVELVDLLVFDLDGYRDASSDQPDVQSYKQLHLNDGSKRCGPADLKDGHKAWGLCNQARDNST